MVGVETEPMIGALGGRMCIFLLVTRICHAGCQRDCHPAPTIFDPTSQHALVCLVCVPAPRNNVCSRTKQPGPLPHHFAHLSRFSPKWCEWLDDAILGSLACSNWMVESHEVIPPQCGNPRMLYPHDPGTDGGKVGAKGRDRAKTSNDVLE